MYYNNILLTLFFTGGTLLAAGCGQENDVIADFEKVIAQQLDRRAGTDQKPVSTIVDTYGESSDDDSAYEDSIDRFDAASSDGAHAGYDNAITFFAETVVEMAEAMALVLQKKDKELKKAAVAAAELKENFQVMESSRGKLKDFEMDGNPQLEDVIETIIKNLKNNNIENATKTVANLIKIVIDDEVGPIVGLASDDLIRKSKAMTEKLEKLADPKQKSVWGNRIASFIIWGKTSQAAAKTFKEAGEVLSEIIELGNEEDANSWCSESSGYTVTDRASRGTIIIP